MALFVCEKCGSVDNPSCGGTYWTKNMDIWPKEYRGKLLCCACTSPIFNDGSANKRAGEWHGRFPRVNIKDWKGSL